MNNWNLVEILKQFSSKQKLFVLVFMVLVIGSTTVITTYLTTTSKDLDDEITRLKEDNTILREDIEKLKEREETLTAMVVEILQKASNLKNNLEEEDNRVVMSVSREAPYLSGENTSSVKKDSLLVKSDTIGRRLASVMNYVPEPEPKKNAKTIEMLDEIINTGKEIRKDNP
jgi:cell division septum initiation protein DivIVA